MLESLSVTVVAEDSVGYETPFLGQHGVSFFLEAHSAGITRRVLVDVAQHPEPLLENMHLLGIDPESIDTVVLTHCHYDHTQGLTTILERIGRTDIPVIAHPDLFRLNFAESPELRHIGVMYGDGPEEITAAGGRLYLVRDALQIVPGLRTSGEVPRSTTYENKETNLKTLRDGRIIVDEMWDELSVYATVRGVGTVIVTGCSHAGVVNITRHAKQSAADVAASGTSGSSGDSDGITAAGETRIAGIIGGFHLIEADQTRIDQTVEDLAREDVAHIYAGHCTGFPAQAALHAKFADAFTPLRTGQRFEFPAP
jgi:7,8-dihydropterin-6-yl-methyl-4-(beta-D-ribofuranosyl)aminobenzene 5'-phosphate synthase